MLRKNKRALALFQLGKEEEILEAE